ncbi:MAG: DUF2283 domain-containing protein [Anaerolineales bacterium]
MKIIWTRHAVERQQAWEVSKGITRQEIEDLVANPDQLVPGDLGALVAQTQRGGGLLRVRYDSESDILLFVVRDEPPVDALEEPGGVIISYGQDGKPVCVEFLNASARQLVQPGEVSVTLQTETVRL